MKGVGGWPLYTGWSELASEEVTVEPDNLKDEKAPVVGRSKSWAF